MSHFCLAQVIQSFCGLLTKISISKISTWVIDLSLYERAQKDKHVNFNIKQTLMSSLLSSREQCLDLANDIGKTCRICGGANHANLLKGTDKKTGTREPINRCIPYLCSFLSNTLFIRKQNDWKLQSFCILSFFSNGFHVLPTLFEKMVFCFKPK